jgi:glycerol-3-phosphate dehydrogenase
MLFDACVIGGGGVVGAAVTRALAQSGLSVVALEKHDSACQETSGLNSRVIHSGFHEAPGSLKSELAREGSRLMIQYAAEHGIPMLQTGMLIAVPFGSIRGGLWKEAASVWHLWRQGRQQDIPFQFIFTAEGVRKIAPIRALGGIFISSVRVINVEKLVGALTADARTEGAQFVYGTQVVSIEREDSCFAVRSSKETVRARKLINSAGLEAHVISVMAAGPQYDIEFIRGDYYELNGGVERWGIRTLVYPAMPPGSRSKGVHLGPRTDGRLYIGPSATMASESAPKELFVEAVRKFLPEIQESDLRWAYYGTRPKCGRDFTIKLERSNPALINLIGIDSPGLSASMAIAKRVLDLCRGTSG